MEEVCADLVIKEARNTRNPFLKFSEIRSFLLSSFHHLSELTFSRINFFSLLGKRVDRRSVRRVRSRQL